MANILIDSIPGLYLSAPEFPFWIDPWIEVGNQYSYHFLHIYSVCVHFFANLRHALCILKLCWDVLVGADSVDAYRTVMDGRWFKKNTRPPCQKVKQGSLIHVHVCSRFKLCLCKQLKICEKSHLKLPKNDLVSGRGNVLNDSKFKVKNKWIIFNANNCMIGSFPWNESWKHDGPNAKLLSIFSHGQMCFYFFRLMIKCAGRLPGARGASCPAKIWCPASQVRTLVQGAAGGACSYWCIVSTYIYILYLYYIYI